MSDPFEKLQGSGGSAEPPLDAIKARALRIQRRRYAALGGGAVAVVLIAMVGIFLGTDPGADRARTLAQSRTATPEATAAPGSAEGRRPASGARLQNPPQEDQVLDQGAAPLPADQSGTTAQEESASAARAAEADSMSSGVEVTLSVSKEALRSVRFTLRACNRSDEATELAFGSGQRYDFEVSRDGELVWRWSDGKAFTQVHGQERWDAGECRTYSEVWDGRNSEGSLASPGSYDAVGILTSSPPLRSQSRSFVVS